MTDLIREAARTYDFRARRSNETDAEYRGALIRHVSSRDYAAAHELRLNKRQADWTSADAQSFREHLAGLPRSTHDPDDHLIVFPVMSSSDRFPVSDESLLKMARRAMAYCVDFRTETPEKQFAPMVSVLLTTGEVLHGLPGREDRIRAIKLLSRQYPVYGFVVAADVFIHVLDRHPVTNVEIASKVDAFVVHVGSRTLRRIFTRRYRLETAGLPPRPRAIFEPMQEDWLERASHVDDPYADVFVSVPVPDAKPS